MLVLVTCRSDTDDADFGCMLPVGALSFDDRFWVSKKGGIGEGGWA